MSRQCNIATGTLSLDGRMRFRLEIGLFGASMALPVEFQPRDGRQSPDFSNQSATGYNPLFSDKLKMHYYDVIEADFTDLVVSRSHETPVLLDIGADWCAPCKILGPQLKKLAHEYQGKFLLANVDADENMRIAGQHRVRGFPTVIAYSRGQEIDRFHSAQGERFLREFIDKLIAVHTAAA